MVSRQEILNEIKRTAEANSRKPLGTARFEQETGIKRSDWEGKYWVRWSDAIQEAGLVPNSFQGSHAEEVLLENYCQLVRELGRIPTKAELKLKRHQDRSFPSYDAFLRIGSKRKLLAKVVHHCELRDDHQDIETLCNQPLHSASEDERRAESPATFGFVYLLKSGRHYKIGRTNALGRREYELSIQLPERAETVHSIRTDDPTGIEAYWHGRFGEKRANGEWFLLDVADVQAFKRRKFM